MAGGRPTDYTDDLAHEICRRISEGVGLYRICEADDMPSRSSVHKWLREIDQFSHMYAHAKTLAAEKIADECLQIAADAMMAETSVQVQAAKLNIDTRQWYAKITEPRKYSDKQQIDHVSTDGSMAPKPTIIELVGPDDKSAD